MAFLSLDADPNPTYATLREVGAALAEASAVYSKARYAAESYAQGVYLEAKLRQADTEGAMLFASLSEPSINGKTVADRQVQTTAWLSTKKEMVEANEGLRQAERMLAMMRATADGAEQAYKMLTHRLNGARAEATLLAAFASADTTEEMRELV